MAPNDILADAFERIDELARSTAQGLGAGDLVAHPAPGANTIGWLLWHHARVQDSHVAELMGTAQVWEGHGWAQGFGLAPDPSNTGYGHTADDVDRVRPTGAEAITGYHDAVASRRTGYVAGLTSGELDRVVDDSFDPPVTVGVRLVSVVSDCLQHLGQAAYARGLLHPGE